MPADALFVGVTTAGKTLLLRRLQSIAQEITSKGECRLESIASSTQPTVGMEMADFRVFKFPLSLREVGSALAGSWPRYFEDCSCIVYTCDVANYATIACDIVEFTNCWEEAKRLRKPIALVCNKIDSPLAVGLGTLIDLFPIEEMVKEGVDVLFTSAHTGQNVLNLLNWLIVHRAGATEDEPQCCFPWRPRASRVVGVAPS